MRFKKYSKKENDEMESRAKIELADIPESELHPMYDSMLEQVRNEITEDNSLRQSLISLLTAWAEVELSHNSTATSDHMEQMRFDISLIIKSGHVNKNVAIVQ